MGGGEGLTVQRQQEIEQEYGDQGIQQLHRKMEMKNRTHAFQTSPCRLSPCSRYDVARGGGWGGGVVGGGWGVGGGGFHSSLLIPFLNGAYVNFMLGGSDNSKRGAIDVDWCRAAAAFPFGPPHAGGGGGGC